MLLVQPRSPELCSPIQISLSDYPYSPFCHPRVSLSKTPGPHATPQWSLFKTNILWDLLPDPRIEGGECLLQKSVLLHCCWTATQKKYPHLPARNKVMPYSYRYRPQTWDPSLSKWLCFSWPIPRRHHSRDSVIQATSTLVKDVGYLDSVITQTVWTATHHGMKTIAQNVWSMICLHPHTSVPTAVKNCRVYLVLLKIFKHLVGVDDSIIHVYTKSVNTWKGKSKTKCHQVWQCIPLISTLRRQKQAQAECCEFKASLFYTVS